MQLNVFFDVDYTMLSMDGGLRPGTREVFERLVAEGHRVHVWSGVGDRSRDVKRHDLDALVAGVYEKPLRDFENGLRDLNVPVRPDFVIDDYREIVEAFGGVQVRPYFFPDDDDEEMERVRRIIGDFVREGRSDDPAFRARNGRRPHSAG